MLRLRITGGGHHGHHGHQSESIICSHMVWLRVTGCGEGAGSNTFSLAIPGREGRVTWDKYLGGYTNQTNTQEGSLCYMG